MACPKCGCRLLTKVGRSKTMLICSDCGHPQPTSDGIGFDWSQLSTVALLVAVAAVAMALSLLSDSLIREQPHRRAPAGMNRPVPQR